MWNRRTLTQPKLELVGNLSKISRRILGTVYVFPFSDGDIEAQICTVLLRRNEFGMKLCRDVLKLLHKVTVHAGLIKSKLIGCLLPYLCSLTSVLRRKQKTEAMRQTQKYTFEAIKGLLYFSYNTTHTDAKRRYYRFGKFLQSQLREDF